MTEKWYEKTAQQTERALNSDAQLGLGSAEVRRRRREDGPNEVFATSFKTSVKQILIQIFTDYTSLITLITLLLAAVFDVTDYLYVMLFIMGAYYISAIITYVKSQNIIQSVNDNILPTAKVIRNGKLYVVRQTDLVRGDVFYISTGDIVPCDARLLECSSLEVLETKVTGNTFAVRKNAGFTDYHELKYEDQKNMIFASTIVTGGTGKAICCEIGNDTAVRKLNSGKSLFGNEQSEVLTAVNDFCKKWTIGMTVWVLLLTIADVLIGISGNGIFNSFILGISSAASSMSEFYVAFAFLSLACGIYFAVNRKGRVNKGALVNYNSKLDTLRNLDCLIVPRSVGFCVNEANIGFVYSNDDMFRPHDYGFKRNSSRAIRYALLSTGIYGVENLVKNSQTRENYYTPEEQCIIDAAREIGEYNYTLESRYKLVEHLSGGVDARFDTTLVKYKNAGVVAIRGDFSQIIDLCVSFTDSKSKIHEMTEEKRTSLITEAAQLSRESYHIVAIASKDTFAQNLRHPSAIYCDLIFEGFIAIRESVIPEVAKNVSRCRAAGIDVIMLCDKNDDSNFSLAESLGIATNHSQIITSYDIKEMRDDIFRNNISQYSVYVGLDLIQKRQLVKYLRESGKKVGYLCSELNEIILISDSDIGFSHRTTVPFGKNGSTEITDGKASLGARNSVQTKETGCEALKFVSDVIVSDPEPKTGTGGFNAMVDAVLCAKGIYHNMHRMIKYMLTSQVAKILIVMFSVISPYTVCTPPQVIFWGLIVDFFALVAIAFEKPTYALLNSRVDRDRLRKPIRGNLFSIATGVLLAIITMLVVFFMYKYNVISTAQIPTCIFLIVILCQLTVLSEYKHENGYFGGNIRINGAHLLFILLVILFVVSLFVFPSFGALFGIVRISLTTSVGIALVPITVFAFCEIGKYYINSKKKKGEGNK